MTAYVIRHRQTRLFWQGSATRGDLWGGASRARQFEFMSTAFAAALFECREDPGAWDVVAVEAI